MAPHPPPPDCQGPLPLWSHQKGSHRAPSVYGRRPLFRGPPSWPHPLAAVSSCLVHDTPARGHLPPRAPSFPSGNPWLPQPQPRQPHTELVALPGRRAPDCRPPGRTQRGERTAPSWPGFTLVLSIAAQRPSHREREAGSWSPSCAGPGGRKIFTCPNGIRRFQGPPLNC